MAPPTAIEPQYLSDTQPATFSDRLSVDGVPARRAKATKITGGVAAHASSDMFKSPVSQAGIGSRATEISGIDGLTGLRQTKSEAMGPYF